MVVEEVKPRAHNVSRLTRSCLPPTSEETKKMCDWTRDARDGLFQENVHPSSAHNEDDPPASSHLLTPVHGMCFWPFRARSATTARTRGSSRQSSTEGAAGVGCGPSPRKRSLRVAHRS